jgi:hypothetical protein
VLGTPAIDDAGATHFELQVQRTVVQAVDVAHASALARGKSPQAAIKALRAGLPLSSAPGIKLNPEWWPWMPLIPFRITVTSVR